MVGLREVGTFMSGLGLVVDQPTKLVLRDRADLKDSGLLASPDALGSTKWTYNQAGRVKGELVIAIVAGLPAAQCQAVIAHEFGHALLAGSQGAQTLAAKLAEGFCESLAAAYLSSRQSQREVQIAFYRIQNNPEPIYGDGYRLVAAAVDRHGVRRVLAALRARHPEQVGLRV